ncbi:MAG: virulence protein RhuM/Fic/DOC family protein [Gammaproteobacteria bacterium]|nr:virulence protein RhuM/Fic/DOC family protein [Gammaproteobacteria bacterium]
MSEIIIYKAKNGQVELDISLTEETMWLSLTQITQLFGRDKSVISRHLANIFKNNELDKSTVVADFATTAQDGKVYQVSYYNLDAVLSVGYRVNSTQATQFRIWATRVLKEHLMQGYTLHKKHLSEHGIQELQESIELLQRTLISNELVNDIGVETLQLIINYAKTWHLLLAYDEDSLVLPEHGKPFFTELSYEMAMQAIQALKTDLVGRGEATLLFGNQKDNSLKGILGSIEQTFGGEDLYKTTEEKAAHLIYFVIKDHPFSDGNKRIGCFLFLLYLKLQNIIIKINSNGLVALALLVAESHPSHKNLLIRLIVNLLMD